MTAVGEWYGRRMANRAFSLENDSTRAELSGLLSGLDAASLNRRIGSTWTIGTSLCHLAFWDQRALFQLKHWQKTGTVETAQLDSQSIDSINQALNMIALEVPGEAAIALALESAAAVDAFVAGIDAELEERIRAAGFERYLRRSLHRRDHLQRIRAALDAEAPMSQ